MLDLAHHPFHNFPDSCSRIFHALNFCSTLQDAVMDTQAEDEARQNEQQDLNHIDENTQLPGFFKNLLSQSTQEVSTFCNASFIPF